MTDTPAGAEDLERLVENYGESEREVIQCGRCGNLSLYASATACASRDAAKSALRSAIRALTERAERAELELHELVEGMCGALRLSPEDTEDALNWPHPNLTGSANEIANKLLKAERQLSTLTASHAAAMEQERERALRWSWEQCYGASGKIAAIRQEDHIARGLAALRGKGEGE